MTDAELTRLLAEKVMGWEIYEYTEWADRVARGQGAGIAYIDMGGRVLRAEALYTSITEWRPLQSMDDAWMLVQWDTDQGYAFLLNYDYNHTDKWQAGFGIASDEFPDAVADTPQRAICLAALRTAGVEVDDDHT